MCTPRPSTLRPRALLGLAAVAACQITVACSRHAAPVAAKAPAAAEQTAAAPIPAGAPVVRIDNFTFGPQALVVKPGTTVTWINNDDIPHTVRAVDGAFKSKVLDSDDRFSFTFAKAGEYAYFCSLHPHMTGKVIVRA